MNNKERKCDYCGLLFSSIQTLSRHKYNSCRLMPKEIKSKLDDKQSKRKNIQNKH